MKGFKLAFALIVLFLVGFGGCSSSPNIGNDLSGKVLETVNSDGYIFLHLENNGKRIWVAVPETKVKVGQQVNCEPGEEVKGYQSKTLKRTFTSIFFSKGIR